MAGGTMSGRGGRARESPRDELGAHMSIAGGLHLALDRGHALGCGAVQVFVKNQRQWAARPLAPEEVRAFAAARRQTGIRWVFAHASYLINLAAPDPVQWARAVDAFTDEVERSEALGLDSLVVHPGSHLGTGLDPALARIVRALDETTRRTPGYRVKIALENTAGAGHTVGARLPELGALVARAARPERIGLCLDTCHLFAAGYDIRRVAGYRQALQECASAAGLDRILAFHLNDARAALGSGLDRHEHIGRGALGLEPFRLLLQSRRLAHVPKVLETPKEPEPAADRWNLARLRALRRRRPTTSVPARPGAGSRRAGLPGGAPGAGAPPPSPR
jgi:deoxyribonuclease-4